MEINPAFWQGKRVFLTGHTGFKGAWLTIWLGRMGAHVTGYALDPATDPNLFDAARAGAGMDRDIRADIRDAARLQKELAAARPDIVIHMAAQAMVLYGHQHPVETFDVNVMGTVNLLEALRQVPDVQAALIVTTDKCYANEPDSGPHGEDDPLGGADPYSASKAAAELVTTAYRSSFFSGSSTRIATARAGNVIGGGDWSENRLLPDCMRAFAAGAPVELRNPGSIRPWQHVLDPLSGYLMLAQALCGPDGAGMAGPWNFAPGSEAAYTVAQIADAAANGWGDGVKIVNVSRDDLPKESLSLRLDAGKALDQLGWQTRWHPLEAAERTARWHRQFHDGADAGTLCADQYAAFLGTPA